MATESRHGQFRPGNKLRSVPMTDELDHAIQQRADEETAAWGIKRPKAAVIRDAVQRYLRTKVPRRQPVSE